MKKRVYIDGIFDLFHRGHLESFYKTKNSLDEEEVFVIVGVVSDSDAEGYKRLPIIREDDRVAIIKGLEVVDEVIFPAPLIVTEDFINKNNIDLIVHGFVDKNDFEKQKDFFKVPIELNKFKTIQYYSEISTSDIIKNIKENY
jgi:cytidyltransferase-like protein